MLSAAAAAVALQMGQVLLPRQHEATLAVLVLRQAYHAPITAGRQPLIISNNMVVVRDVGDALHQAVDGDGSSPPPRQLGPEARNST
jgi:hypothetical protein